MAYFDLDSARAELPRLRRELGVALQLHAALRRAVYDVNDSGYDVDWAMLNGELELEDDAEEIDRVRVEKARAIYQLLRDRIEAIEARGITIEALVEGAIEFRSWLEGREEVRLSWRLGESLIGHYRRSEEEPEDRRPIADQRFFSQRSKEPTSRSQPAPEGGGRASKG